MLKKYIFTTGAATTVKQTSFSNDINVMIFVLACGVTHAANRRWAWSFVHPIGDPRLTAAKQQTTLSVRSG
jgi:hypothetical protein